MTITELAYKNSHSLTPHSLGSLLIRAVKRLHPRVQAENPILFCVYAGMLLAVGLFMTGYDRNWFTAAIALTLLFTILFSNAAELTAQDMDDEQINTIRIAHGGLIAKRIETIATRHHYVRMPSAMLKKGDLVYVEAGDLIPADGIVIFGVASVDESSITGESAPVIREAEIEGGRCEVTWGTRILSDSLVIRVTAGRGETTLDERLAMIAAARRQQAPSEVALSVFLIATTIGFVLTAATLYPFSAMLTSGPPIELTMLIALFVCLTPTTIAGLMPAIGIAGASRLLEAGILTTSGQAVETAGDVTILLLDKTGTITYGNRQAAAFLPATGIAPEQLARAALFSSLSDETPEGKSIVTFAMSRYGLKKPDIAETTTFIPFSADTRLSGVRTPDSIILKGASDAVQAAMNSLIVPDSLFVKIDQIARTGGTPLLVAQNGRALGVIHLKDVVKTGIKDRLAALRAMGIQSVMMTGDNPMTAAAVAAEAGVDDFIAQAVPETKLKFIRNRQEDGEIVAMVGDGANDAPALAQADIAVAMQTGSQEAKEAANMIDLDSHPTKLIEIVRIGKQLLMTRGSLATFSLASDVSKFVTIVPATLMSAHPALAPLNFLHLSNPHSAVLAALLFNALIILILIPHALHGIGWSILSPERLLRRHILLYGIGGALMPMLGIKLLDMGLALFVHGGSHG